MLTNHRCIHFIGIGGIGMSGIAEILLNLGFPVTGSDATESQNVTRLREKGANIHIGHAASNLGNPDVVVTSTAIHPHNPEVLEAHRKRIPIVHRSEMLAELMHLKKGIVITGTHGKTTTASLVATVAHAAQIDPTAVIGGRINAFESNAKLGDGDFFIVEADESDGSFVRLSPYIALITNIDRDHMDHYANFDEILRTFEAFIDRIPVFGALVACIDDPGVQLVLPKVKRQIITYGLRPDADITATHVEPRGLSTAFIPVIRGAAQTEVLLQLPGKHNVCNALGAFAVAHLLGISPTITARSLSSFTGILHRNTVVANWNNVTIIDDYAHNPKKISCALQALREAYPEATLCAVFQPHRYTRWHSLSDEFSRAFSAANHVIVTPIYAASEQPIAGITRDSIAHAIRLNSSPTQVMVAEDLNDAAQLAATLARNNHTERPVIVVTLGAGDVSTVGKRIHESLTTR